MAERSASDSEGSDIPDVEENVRGDSDDETVADPLDRAQDVFVDNGNDNDGSQPRLVANLLAESSDSDDEFLVCFVEEESLNVRWTGAVHSIIQKRRQLPTTLDCFGMMR